MRLRPIADLTRSARRASSAVGTQGGLEVGLKTYPQTIPLADHEVILTFDDGPDAVNTPKILDALKAECVRATFFEIGRNAAALPDLARREVLDGHTVAFHTWSHPQPTLRFLPGGEPAARADILKGMIAVEKAAYGRDVSGSAPKDLKLEAPFFRFPGFADTRRTPRLARRQRCRHLRGRPLGVRLDQDDAGGGTEAGDDPAGEEWPQGHVADA